MHPDLDWTRQLTRWIRAACVMEATAPKPGNVHPGASFEDATYQDFVASAEIVAPVLARAGELGVGWVMLDAVRETREAIGKNTNLGIIVLLAPLAAVPRARCLLTGIPSVLERLSVDDARHCYAAIRLATPGGLGTVEEADVAEEPAVGLVEVMRLAATRDRVAAQYSNGFRDVVEAGLPRLANDFDPAEWQTSVVRLHLELMADFPDTLIARKCGWKVAAESMQRARAVLEADWPHAPQGVAANEAFDDWLREDGHCRNPGTTADLVAAILFAGLRDGIIDVPAELNDSIS